MQYIILSFVAGVLTVLTPCVLPLLPVIIGGSLTQRHRTRPYIITAALVVSIVGFTLLLKVSSALINVDPSVWTTISGTMVLAFGIVTVFPSLWENINRRLNLINQSDKLLQASGKKSSWLGAALIGLSLGPVFSSCSPTYAIILATVLPQNFFAGVINLIVYAVGLSAMLLLIAMFGQKLVKKLRWAANPTGWFRRGLGMVFILVGLTIITGYEKKAEVYLLEKGWINATKFEIEFLQDMPISSVITPTTTTELLSDTSAVPLNVKSPYLAPELTDIEAWINSDGETLQDLRGKVVLIDFWTYSCINCIRTLPYLKDWYEKYHDDGLVIIGVHAPEFAFEQVLANVQQAVTEYQLPYPIALDNNFATWQAYDNHYWPAKYFIDREGKVRHTHFGEGDYSESEAIIRYLLSETGADITDPIGSTTGDAPPIGLLQTPETYLGYARADRFANANEAEFDTEYNYTLNQDIVANQWSLGGEWIMEDEKSTSVADGASLRLQFSANDVYLVMASVSPAEVEVKVNNQTVDPVLVNESTLYHVVALDEFGFNQQLDLTFPAGVEVYAFTFGSDVAGSNVTGSDATSNSE